MGICRSIFSVIVPLLLLAGCSAKESHRTLTPEAIPEAVVYRGEPVKVALGEFVNRSTYMNGIFADSGDRLGAQAGQILTTHISQSPAFVLVDRRNLEALAQEAKFSGRALAVSGADYLVTGAVTEFGRRETGERTLAGILHKSRTQALYAKVSLSVIDAKSSRVLKSYQGAGEYSLTNKEVLGTGATAGYDGTLADKVLNLAIIESVQRMTEGKSRGEW